MAEPTTSPALIVAVNAALLGLFGFDWYALFGAAVGTGLMLLRTDPEDITRLKAILLALLTMAFGAIAGTALLTYIGRSQDRSLIVLASLVFAFGAQNILTAIISRVLGSIWGARQ